MKQRIFSIAMALCLCLSLVPAARAADAEEALQEDSALAEESGNFEVPDAGFDWSTSTNYPTQDQITAKLLSLQNNDRYKDNEPWDDSNHSYDWNGGTLPGNVNGGTGCAAFAFELSDFVFRDLQARLSTDFALSDVRVGDILHGTSHTVIVIQVSDTSVKVAEGNVHINGNPGVVSWGRTLTRDEVESFQSLVTRYPVDYELGADADDPIVDENGETAEGTLENGISWKVTKGGTLSIAGSGEMPETIDYLAPPWTAYADRITKIEIGSGVTTISNNAFRGSGVLSVTISSSVKSIGDDAFRECESLTTVTIDGSGLETIGERAFRSCGSLVSITLPASVKEVGAGTFYQCQKMTAATFTPGSNPVTIGSSLFAGCWALETLQLPKEINSSIGEDMFANCHLLASLTIPEGATSIDARAFASSGLKQLAIPASVTELKTASFSNCNYLTDIYFGGSEAEWNSIVSAADVKTALENVRIHYGEEMPDDGSSGDNDNDNEEPGGDETPGGTPETPPSAEHVHNWALDWSSSSSYHWHECLADGCGVTADSGKDGYEAHRYGAWVVDQGATSSRDGSRHRTCTVCGYTQTARIPATGSPSSSGSSSYDPPSSTTVTTQNPDGSTTTTKTDYRTGAVTETTRKPDGSQTVVETKKDGTVTTQETDPSGNKTETVVKPDGSSTITIERRDGAAAVIAMDSAGMTEAEVSLPASVVSAAQQSGEAAVLPIPEVQAAQSMEAAPSVTVNTGSAEPVKVEIPAAAPTPGTVAVIVHADGTEEIVKTSVPTEHGVTVSLPDGATVKIIDNSKEFVDVPSPYWGADAVDFVSSRELFVGITETAFAPENPMTRAMFMVVLARLDGADTTAGTTWYEKGMEWAITNGISDGSSLDSNITREQLITILWRYAGSPAVSGTLSSFSDAGQVSGYAQEALRWAVENGVITGFDNGQLRPQGQATRAQVAQILMNFMEM